MEENENRNELGDVKISNEVIGIIAGLAATEIAGVARMSGGITGGITELLSHKNLSKGVKVESGESEAAVDLFVVIDYGVSIPEVCQNVQTNVKNAIEGMTGLDVVEVNIHVQNVAFPKEQPKPDMEEEESETVN